jgi:hyperosmotically inducible periplasmic protein
MQFRPSVLAISITLAAGALFLVSGCGRVTDTPVPTTAAASTTVGTEIDDTVITAKVKAALLEDKDVKSFDIKVETRKGVVQLSGFVDNRHQADRAKTIAQGVEGVKNIDDAMTLRGDKVTVGNLLDDSMVTANVKSALWADPDIRSFEVAVATHKGEVQLSGFVGTQAQIDHVVAMTQGVAGVTRVINQLAIKK